jgi:DNA-directed RNA polymerase specialized sigma24 family protein
MLGIEVTSTRLQHLFFVVTQTPNLSTIQWRRRKRTPEERMKGTTTPLQSAPKPQPATKAEIDQAIEALTDEDTERIEQTALNRINRIWRAANGRSHDDLIQEALTRILDGTRHWYKGQVCFTLCLVGAIRSIASEWAGHRKRNKELPEYASPESDHLRTDDQGKTTSPFDDLRSPALNVEEEQIEADMTAEQEAENKTLADKIEAAFADDERATIVLMGFQDGMDGPAICAAFEFSEKEFRTTTRRIQRAAKKIMDEHHGK